MAQTPQKQGGTARKTYPNIAFLEQKHDVGALIICLSDRDEVVRKDAADALGRFHDVNTMPALLESLKDPNWEVRSHSALAIKGLFRNTGDTMGHFERRSSLEPHFADPKDTRAVEALLKLCDDKNPYVRRSAVRSLGAIGNPIVVSTLMHFLTTNDNVLKYETILAIGNIGDKRANNSIRKSMFDENPDIEYASMEAMGSLAEASDLSLLLKKSSTDRSRYSGQIERAIHKIGASGIEPLIESIPYCDYFTSQIIFDILSHSSNPVAFKAILTYSNRPNDGLRISAISALGQRKESEAIDELVHQLLTGDKVIALYALNALRSVKDERIIAPIAKRFVPTQSDFPYSVVVEILNTIGTMSAKDQLLFIFNSSHGYYRQRVANVLASLFDKRIIPWHVGRLDSQMVQVRLEAIKTLSSYKDASVLPDIKKLVDDPDISVRAAAERAIREITAVKPDKSPP